MINKIILQMAVLMVAALASYANCNYQLFNVTANNNTTISDVVKHIANECSYTIVVKDQYARNILDDRLYLVNLQDATVDELLDIVLTENELNYTIENNTLRISYLFTKTFYVDYISTDRSGTSDTSVSLSSSKGSGESAQGNSGGSSSESSSGITITSDDSFVFWSKLKDEIRSILNRPQDSYYQRYDREEEDKNDKLYMDTNSSLFINKEAGLVTVTGTKKQINRVEDYIDKLHERLMKQVLVDVKILSVTMDDSKTTGIDWSQIYGLQNFKIASMSMMQNNLSSWTIEDGEITGETTFAQGSRPEHADLLDIRGSATVGEVIKFLKGEGDVQSISNPKVLTLNNQPAIVSVGNEYFYKITTATSTENTTSEGEQIDSVFAGVLLDITPEISKDGTITLKINPSLSETVNAITSNTNRTMPPDLTRRQLSSVVSLQDGEHVILGGLITSKDEVSSSKVPILGSIPILSYAFERKEVTKQLEELVIIITPKIITNETSLSLEELGYKNLEQ